MHLVAGQKKLKDECKVPLVQSYGDYLKYATLDDEMISRMLHLLPDTNNILLDSDVQSIKACTAEYKIDNRSV